MKIKIGNAPCSWGVIENVAGERSGYIKVLDEIAATGYEGTELGDWGFMPTDPKALKDELSQRDLLLTGSWCNTYLTHPSRYEESLSNCMRAASQLRLVGIENAYINLGDECYEVEQRTKNAGRATSDMMFSSELRKNFASNANRLKEHVEGETGVQVLFHHHIGTWIETNEEIDFLMHETNLGLCFDSGHCFFGCGDPLTYLKKYYDRVGAVHFKDCSAKVADKSRKEKFDAFQSLENGIFPELGKGNVDFQSLGKYLTDSDYSGWIIVEQDVIPGMGSPKESAQRNREFITQLGL